jgi:hypothetical protein
MPEKNYETELMMMGTDILTIISDEILKKNQMMSLQFETIEQ